MFSVRRAELCCKLEGSALQVFHDDDGDDDDDDDDDDDTGEANLDHAEEYACQMRAMVAQWRSQFYLQSLGETKADFPFGYVQVSMQVTICSVSSADQVCSPKAGLSAVS